MYNYGKWLMTILRSLNIICIHICLITAEESRDFQMAGCFRISLGGQGSRSLKRDASMNKYVVWKHHRSTKTHYCWLLICSVSIRLPDMCILINNPINICLCWPLNERNEMSAVIFGTLHNNFLEKNRWQGGCNMLWKPLRQSQQSQWPIPAHNRLCPI